MAKKRKLLPALVLALILAMVACSGGEDTKQPASVNGDSGKDAGEHTSQTAAGEITVAETVLYDAGGIRITATGYEDGWLGPEVKLLIENSSAGNVRITSDAVSVNGYMMSGASVYSEVAAGKKANEALSILSSELKQAGITVPAELQFYLKIADSDTWDTVAISELLTLTTSAAPYEQQVDDSGDVLYDEGGIRVVCKGLKQDIIWDGTVVFYLENNSGREISVYAENVSVNGFMTDVGLWSDLRPGTRIVDGMSMLDLSDLQIEHIDQIKNIELNLRIVDADNWADIATTGVLTLNFE